MHTWNNDWIWQYQSVWCTVERIKYSNSINGNELKKYLNAKSVKKTIYDLDNIYTSKYRFDKEKLVSLCGKNIFLILNDEIKETLGCVSNFLDIEKYIVTDLRICPECIKYGYHSIFHQLNLFKRCLFHDSSLMVRCPKCGESYSYNLRYDITRGFICKCGYNYLKTTNSFDLINIWNQNSTINYDINTFYNIRNNKFFFSSFNFFINRYVNKNLDYYLDDNSFILNKILKKHELKTKYMLKFKPVFYGSRIPNKVDKKEHFNSYIIIEQYIKILKYIDKFFRKKIKFKDYKFYISRYIYFSSDIYKNSEFLESEKAQYKGIDEYLYAYIMWKKNIEEVENYYEIDKLYKNPKIYNNFNNYDIDVDYTRIQQVASTIFYQYIDNEIEKYSLLCKTKNNNYEGFDDIGILISGLERIIGDILMKYFYDWLNFIKDKKKNSPDQIINFYQNINFNFSNYLLCYDELNRVECIIKS
ncbi:hypothetical protein [Intestinibacter sp.]